MIYLASPYSGTPEEQEYRFKAVEAYTAKLLSDGFVVFSPIVYAHEMAKRHNFETTAAAWEKFNTTMIRFSSEMLVYTLEGWQFSKGVQAEIALAKQLRIEITYVRT